MTKDIICLLKRLCGLLLFCCTTTSLHADIITGRLIDKESKQPLEAVNISVASTCRAKSSTSYWILKTDSAGYFKTPHITGDEIRIEFSLIGYYPVNKKYMPLGLNTDTLKMGNIAMTISDILLKSAEVKAKARCFVINGDTVVFNPSAFKLAQGARLEELISQLPGVTQKDGKLEWMGNPIRILMEGKELFGNSNLLTSTLPAEAIERIKAYDKAGDMEKRTGKKDGNEDYVLDLKIKPGFLEKWYGDIDGTYETEDYYRTHLDALFLSTKDPLLAAVNIGNNNKNIFSRGMRYSSSGSTDNFSKQQMGAFAHKHEWETQQGKKKLNHYYTNDIQANHTDSWGNSSSYTENYLPNAERTFNMKDNKRYKHEVLPQFNHEFTFRPDTLTQIRFEANTSYEKKVNTTSNRDAVFNTDPYELSSHPLDVVFSADSAAFLQALTTRSLNKNKDISEGFRVETSTNIYRQLPHKGELYLSAYYSYHDQRNTGKSERTIDYFRSGNKNTYEQLLRKEPLRNHTFSTNAEFRQWWGEHVLFSANYNYEYRKIKNRQHYYNLHLIPGFDPALPPLEEELLLVEDHNNSYRDYNKSHKQNLSLSAEINYNKLRLTPALKIRYDKEQMDYERGLLDTIAHRDTWSFEPSFNLNYRISRTSNLEAYYSYHEELPHMLNTLAYTDCSNPLYITEGNPFLKRSKTHKSALIYRANLYKKQQSIKFSLYYNRYVDPVGNILRLNPATGVYRSTFTNLKDGDNLGLNIEYNQFINDEWEVSNILFLDYGSRYAYLVTTSPDASPVQNRQRTTTINEYPSFSYRTNTFNLKVSGEYTLHIYDNNGFNTITDRTSTYGGNISADYRWRNFRFISDLSVTGKSGYTFSTMNRVRPIWDVCVSYSFLKNKAKLEMGFNDILNQSTTHYSYMNAYSNNENWFERHTCYLWTKLSYHFDAKK